MNGAGPRRLELTLATGLLGLYLVTGNGSAEGAIASALGALVGLVAFRLYRRLGAGEGVATLVTVALGCATLLWPSARRDPHAVLEALLVTGLVEALLAAAAGELRPVVVGLWAGMLIFDDLRFVPGVLGAGVHLGLAVPRGRRAAALGEMAAPVVVLGVLAALGLGGKLPDPDRYREHILDGLWGLFLSTGKGVLLFSPPLVLGLVAIPAAARADRPAVRALALTIVPVVLLQAKSLLWSGGHTWGVPDVVCLHPAALAPLAIALAHRRVDLPRRVAIAAVLVLGLGVQLLASAFAPGTWLTIAHDVGRAWLGKPDLGGADPMPCIDCFEQTYRVDWLPPFQPILGHLWLLRHVTLGHDYERAQRDAPWRRYVNARFDATAAYRGASVDWWAGDGPLAGPGLLAVECLLVGAGALRLRRLLAPGPEAS